MTASVRLVAPGMQASPLVAASPFEMEPRGVECCQMPCKLRSDLVNSASSNLMWGCESGNSRPACGRSTTASGGCRGRACDTRRDRGGRPATHASLAPAAGPSRAPVRRSLREPNPPHPDNPREPNSPHRTRIAARSGAGIPPQLDPGRVPGADAPSEPLSGRPDAVVRTPSGGPSWWAPHHRGPGRLRGHRDRPQPCVRTTWAWH